MDYLDRLLEEKDALYHKVQKLDSFLFSDEFMKLSEAQQGLLQIQISCMEGYLKCLNERIVTP